MRLVGAHGHAISKFPGKGHIASVSGSALRYWGVVPPRRSPRQASLLPQGVLPCHMPGHHGSHQALPHPLGIAAVEQYHCRRRPRWAGYVSRMPMDRLPRQLLTGFVANPRPAGSPLVTWGRILKKALIKCGRSPSSAVWSQAVADRMF